MHLRKLGRSELNVSELCLGSMQFGWTADEATSFAVMDAFVQAGGNFIDTADIYTTWGPLGMAGAGKSEEIIGRWMKARGNRSKVIIATKLRGRMKEGPGGEGLARDRVIKCCEDSLRRLQVDHLDLYQCHSADLKVPIEETLGALDQLVKAGKVRVIGASNYPAWRLMEALAQSEKHGYARFNSYQPEYSLMERGLFETEPRPLCRNYGLGVIPYSPLAGGFLTGKYRRGAGGERPRHGYWQEIRERCGFCRNRETRRHWPQPRQDRRADRAGLVADQPGGHVHDCRREHTRPTEGFVRCGRLSAECGRDDGAQRPDQVPDELAGYLGLIFNREEREEREARARWKPEARKPGT